ncbi:quinol:cytochrome C oxidoreductase [Flammeovirgaceae bacterium SG7u.111]|nr:quinol:cytochrome C oxidoreductase [Flammeovirgaceae bacterium SG7u.132]WPO36675.1 quinol:cytochrome C oxidoreductase [Flammeovirgaceae bacterium SG7u.111]
MAAEIHDIDEKFVFTPKLKKTIFTVLGIGVAALVIGMLIAAFGGGHAEHAAEGGEHHAFHWTTKLWASMWVNNVYFTGIALIGIFFVAIQYIASAGWSASILRIPATFGYFLPVAFVLTLIVFAIANRDLFHWTHTYLYDKTSPEFDSILFGKRGYFFIPGAEEASHIPYFYYLRLVAFFAIWMIMFRLIRKETLKEDVNGGIGHYKKLVKFSGAFLVFFGLSSSVAAWDWVMSIDPHWYSTMFGWYVFASWFVSGLAAITLILVLLKDAGYLKIVNENHLHDMGKFVFAFSIFWTYIWFSQFLLIYYSNIPEEGIYFVERLKSDIYSKYIFLNLIFNFFFPFLVLMTRDAKRKSIILKVVCIVVLVGHWFDFFLMVHPGTLKENGGFGFMEIGLTMIYLAVFVYIALNQLSKVPLIAKNHPMLEESIHHHT